MTIRLWINIGMMCPWQKGSCVVVMVQDDRMTLTCVDVLLLCQLR